MRTKEQVFDYLIQPSPLFLKQVVKVEETKSFIVVQDIRKIKNLFIPDQVIKNFEYNLKIIKAKACKTNEYDGVYYLVLSKSNI